MEIPARRRVLLAVCAITIAATVLRPQVAAALVSRGDEFLGRGDAASARMYYKRAMTVDRDSRTAVDRFAFSGAMSHERPLLHQALAAVTDYLSDHAADAPLLEDRALCYQLIGRFSDAASDFAAAASVTGSARDFTFAGWAEFRAGNRSRARRLWREALSHSPAYGPARAALRKVPS